MRLLELWRDCAARAPWIPRQRRAAVLLTALLAVWLVVLVLSVVL